jgi:hypothetical protein
MSEESDCDIPSFSRDDSAFAYKRLEQRVAILATSAPRGRPWQLATALACGQLVGCERICRLRFIPLGQPDECGLRLSRLGGLGQVSIKRGSDPAF